MFIENIYKYLPDSLQNELFQLLANSEQVKIERIVSNGHASSIDDWYDQDKNEWVILLSGSAGLQIEGEKDIIHLLPGDYILLPAHLKHRVEYTDSNCVSIWLAIHY